MNIGSKSQNDLTVNGHVTENEIVHIQHIHSTAFEIFHQAFSNRKVVILIAKGNSYSYNIISQIYLGKSPHLHLTLLYLYKKAKLLGCPKETFGLPQCFNPKLCHVVSAHTLYNILHLKQKFIEKFYEEGPALSLINFFHAWASATMLSKSEGSRKWMLILYFAA